jgi:hypothetical protein
MLRSSALALAAVLGILAIGNGVFMLVSPDAWYLAVPGVPDTGPFNQHFLRDIGMIFLVLGGAFLAGVARPELRVVLWGAATLWLAGHALFHLWEVAVGICAPSVIPRDFPGVTLPTLLGMALTYWAWRDARAGHDAAPRLRSLTT